MSGDTQAGEFRLEEFLPYRLSVAANRTARLFAQRYSTAFGLSIPEWRVLAVVGRFGGLSSTEVAERTAMDKVKVSRAVHALVGRGLLRRRADTADRRVQRLEFTTAGRRVHAGIVPLARQLEAELLAGLAEPDRTALSAALAALEARLAGLGAADGPD